MKTFKSGDRVKFTGKYEGKVTPAIAYVSSKKQAPPGHVWLEFSEIPGIENLRLAPLDSIELNGRLTDRRRRSR